MYCNYIKSMEKLHVIPLEALNKIYEKTADFNKSEYFLKRLPDNFEKSVDSIKLAIEKRTKFLAENIKDKKDEEAYILDTYAEIIDNIKGNNHSVKIKQSLLKKNYSLLHNHPNGSTLSDADVKVLVEDNLFQISAVDPAGGEFYMRKTSLHREEDKESALKELEKITQKSTSKQAELIVSGLGLRQQTEEMNKYMKDIWTKFADDYGYEYCHKEGDMSLINFEEDFARGIEDFFKEWSVKCNKNNIFQKEKSYPILIGVYFAKSDSLIKKIPKKENHYQFTKSSPLFNKIPEKEKFYHFA